MAVWLMTDNYDHTPDPTHVSATGLLKPMRQIVLGMTHAKQLGGDIDLSDLIASRMGTAIHDSIEKAWKYNSRAAMLALGYPDKLVNSLRINSETAFQGLAIYMEQRASKEFHGFTISGKFDMVMDGVLEDYKSTQSYSYIAGGNTQDYIRQGSIYRWLNQDIITADYMHINYLFTDWKAHEAKADKKYPQSKILQRKLMLLSIPETESFLRSRLDMVKHYLTQSPKDFPHCTPEELWQKPPVFKYYKDPTKTARSTKNYDSQFEADARMGQEGKGIVKAVPSEIKRCHYCNVRAVCTDAEKYEHQGLLRN